MALNPDGIGKTIGPFTKAYTWKDTVLYALGVGAGFSELDYCYEKDLKVIPSFGIVTLYDFMPQLADLSNVNLAGILHGEQELIFHNPIPPEGTLNTEGAITHYYDKGPGKGALIVAEFTTRHSNGRKLFTNIVTVFARLDGGFGGPDAPKKEVLFPQRGPDVEVAATPPADQPLIFRLSGDLFALHVDREFASLAGFDKPIMHGLCTHGYACRVLIENLILGAPENARRMACRFKSPLYPGVPIRVQIWKLEPGKALWRVVNAQSGDVVIDHGIFEYGEAPRDEIRFDGRVAVVTGAGGGLGRAYALELARRGAKVVVNDFGGSRDGAGKGSSAAADAVVAQIKAAGGEAVASYDTVATAQGGAAIVKTALSAFGTLDILINNAGILRDKSFLKMEEENWRAVLAVHLDGAYYVTRPAFEVMKEKQYGRIVLTTSAAGLYGNFGQSNYSAAKMALVGLMATLKLEGRKYNITVNTIAPVAASRLTEDILPPELFERSRPEFVAPLVMHLCSERCEASGEIFNAGMGCFNRVAVLTAPPVALGGPKEPLTAELIRDNWQRIDSLEGAVEMPDANAAVLALIAPPAAEAGKAAAAAAEAPAVAAIFEQMPGRFNPEAAAGLDVVFQFSISGPGGGEWSCAIKDGACRIAAGRHAKPACTLTMADADFVALMSGKLKAMAAYTGGKLKIEGDVMKSQLLERVFKIGA
jgi:NAD(P)-dependent dehydrogenase (short-subunit alcohol dehydrogenase family)/acyl dehydratase/putative sterol carrier protein